MVTKDGVALDTLLFGEGTELVDFKCFRGDREDVSPAEIKEQIHSAMMQKRMDRATISEVPPQPDVPPINVRKFVADLMASR